MGVKVTFGQSEYFHRNSRRFFGLGPMAIVFSLPWALLMWSCVISCIPCRPFSYGLLTPPDRMVTFFIALFLYCFSIPTKRTFISIVSSSVIVVVFVAGCICTTWEPSDEGGVWSNRVQPSIRRALHSIRTSARVVKSLRDRFSSDTPNEVGSVHSLAELQNGGGDV